MQQLLFLLLLGFVPHPIHLSVTEVYRAEANEDLAFSITFFMDDFGDAARYNEYADKINRGKMTVEDFILQHLQEKLKFKVNGKSMKYSIEETESNFPAVTCYMQFKNPPSEVQTLEVENTLLLDHFNDQKNMVHLRIAGKKEGSMILTKKKKKGMTSF